MRRRTLKEYLKVRPQETQWITTETDIDYDVLSNTRWNIQ